MTLLSPFALIMLAAGIGIPILAALNARLGQFLGSPAAACVVLFAVAFLCALAFLALMRLSLGPQQLARVFEAPRHLLVAGALVAFYVLSITHVAPHFGVGNAVFCVLLGQLVSAAAIDHFGLFGAQVSPLTPMRSLGLAVMGLGVWLTQQG